ncbi:MAG TPA: alpha/beta hydrolase [bacterium]|nr:alpha/beta hydrolase [bacterium]
MQVRVGDVDLFYEMAGEGPPCVLVHGGPGVGPAAGRLAQYAPLAGRARLIAYDHRGHGRSSKAPEATYTQARLAEDLWGLCRALGADRPILLGTSAGGFISLIYAATYPEALRALILVGTSPSKGFMARAAANMERLGTPAMRDAYRRLWDGSIDDPAEFRRAFETIQPMYYHDKGFAPVSLAGRDFDPMTRRALIRDYDRYDVREELGRIRVPTWIGVGRHDWICPVPESEELARGIPGSELHIFEHSGHSPQTEETTRFMESVRTFLNRL